MDLLKVGLKDARWVSRKVARLVFAKVACLVEMKEFYLVAGKDENLVVWWVDELDWSDYYSAVRLEID
jgi:hypothetical protein